MKYVNLLSVLSFIMLIVLINGSQAQNTDSVRAFSGQSGKVSAFQSSFDTLEKSYPGTARLAIFFMIMWLLLVIGYLYWAIIRYSQNYGLSEKEWKILNPEAYARPEELEKFIQIRTGIIERTRKEFEMLNPGRTFDGVIPALAIPSTNPYLKDSFGLPPGTIRGILAMTAMFSFVMIECANLFSPANLEKDFSELLMVFQMVIAFYFGAKAVEVLKKRQDSKEEEKYRSVREATAKTEDQTAQQKTTQPIPAKDSSAKTTPVIPVEKFELPAEKAVMPEEKVSLRQQNTLPVIMNKEVISKVYKKSIASLEKRIMGLTASFETGVGFPECFGVVTGNFDGQGISFGALQWCIGQNTLQELFESMMREHPKVTENIFSKDQFAQFKGMLKGNLSDQMNWAKSIQITERKPNNSIKWVILPEWKTALQRLGLTEEMISIEVTAASARFAKAQSNCSIYRLRSERGLALMFDINVQNGHVDVKGAGANILKDFQNIPLSLSDDEKEVERMRIVARRRAEVANPRWVQDVLKRKMTIAEGEGVVHGKKYVLAKDFDITLRLWDTTLITETIAQKDPTAI